MFVFNSIFCLLRFYDIQNITIVTKFYEILIFCKITIVLYKGSKQKLYIIIKIQCYIVTKNNYIYLFHSIFLHELRNAV